MPSLITKNGRQMWRGAVQVSPHPRSYKTFPGDQRGQKAALLWEAEERKRLLATVTGYLSIFEWLTKYLDFVEVNYRKATMAQAHKVCRSFIAHAGPYLQVADVTPRIVMGWLQAQAATSGHKANKYRAILSAAWTHGKFIEGFPQTMANPVLQAPRFKHDRQERHIPSEDDFWKVHEAAEGQDRVLLLAYLHLGARKTELYALRWHEVDWAANEVTLWTTKRKSGKQADRLPMTKQLREALRGWWEIRPVKESPFVFVHLSGHNAHRALYGEPITNRQGWLKRLCDKAKVTPFTTHAIRHLTASVLYRQGNPMAVIQSILRHTAPSTTERYIQSLHTSGALLGALEGLERRGEVVPMRREYERD
jgi:integrase